MADFHFVLLPTRAATRKLPLLADWAQNTDGPGILPEADTLYGTELFELNTNLADKVYDIIKDVKLNYTEETSYWASTFPADIPASHNPTAIRCDTATSDVYYAGTLLSEAFGNFTDLLTRGEGKYCMTAQVSPGGVGHCDGCGARG